MSYDFEKSDTFLRLANEYYKEYCKCKWWQFKKKYNLKRNYKSALYLAIRFNQKSKMIQNRKEELLQMMKESEDLGLYDI